MSTETSTSRTRPARPAPDPLQMSAAEKCMAEWEARHDVAARGHRSSPEALQHYVARSRLSRPVPPHPRTTQSPTVHERERQQTVVPARTGRHRPRSLLARLLRRSG
ncbi:hypothetical protein SAMN05660662_0037 [Blastococcus aurantiacus]|uniref:Uncharacterized protein n=1 Tax=Blastococcus aurantiacus TaxID=1550231 RepID=A0A1G7QVZ3_9ACTN|nr:hypothetical protein [Blastococcus aurantiacus]SDG02701.1 hypothetical protein SAMN05660662_0037 [Blastococcus aurantiacus]